MLRRPKLGRGPARQLTLGGLASPRQRTAANWWPQVTDPFSPRRIQEPHGYRTMSRNIYGVVSPLRLMGPNWRVVRRLTHQSPEVPRSGFQRIQEPHGYRTARQTRH